jgi:uncharacterized spore protein YtfJ
MEKKEIKITDSLKISGVTLIPVSKVIINRWYSKRGVAFFGSNQPVSIIAVTPTAKKAFRITGEEITFDQLAQEIPEIMDTLEEIESDSYNP